VLPDKFLGRIRAMRTKIALFVAFLTVATALTSVSRAVSGSAPFQWVTIFLTVVSQIWVPLGVASLLEEVPKEYAKHEAHASQQSDGGGPSDSGASGMVSDSSRSSLVVKDSVDYSLDD
jgi:hypothetical protein